MKRQGDNIVNQPAVKKPDVNMSTDFRSKIGAKLQTLLNGFTPDRRLFPRSRRQLYEDLFGESQHSTIIIDPTIVIKSEAPDTEESSNDATNFNSQNFLLSAKSRITELLNKRQDDANKTFKENEKENSLSINEYGSTSSFIPNSSHIQSKSLLNNNLSKKRKISFSKDDSSEPQINQVRLKNLVVVVEDIMNSKNSTEFSHLLPTNLVENENASPNVEFISGNFSEQSENVVAIDNATDEVSVPFISGDEVECVINDSSSVINDGSSVINQSSMDPHLSTDECDSMENNILNASMSKSHEVVKTSESVQLNDSNLIPNFIPLGDILLEETTDQFSCSAADDSELVDDPGTHQAVMDITSYPGLSESNHYEIHEPEVVLLCVKRPTHEVITLEDDIDDSDDVIEEVHECVQCGKAFRARSLLNFHIRMHGSDSSSPSSSSLSCIE